MLLTDEKPLRRKMEASCAYRMFRGILEDIPSQSCIGQGHTPLSQGSGWLGLLRMGVSTAAFYWLEKFMWPYKLSWTLSGRFTLVLLP